MAVFDPDKYVDEDEGKDFTVPDGQYEVYFSELEVKVKYDPTGAEKKSLNGKVVFANGPRAGKYFYHSFWLWNEDRDKRKKALEWFGNFFRAIGQGPIEIEDAGELAKVLNRPFVGDVYVDEYQGKKSNKLRPWGFHAAVSAPLPPLTTGPGSGSGSSGQRSGSQSGTTPKVVVNGVQQHEDDFPDGEPPF